jgi:hypothetical protein
VYLSTAHAATIPKFAAEIIRENNSGYNRRSTLEPAFGECISQFLRRSFALASQIAAACCLLPFPPLRMRSGPLWTKNGAVPCEEEEREAHHTKQSNVRVGQKRFTPVIAKNKQSNVSLSSVLAV